MIDRTYNWRYKYLKSGLKILGFVFEFGIVRDNTLVLEDLAGQQEVNESQGFPALVIGWYHKVHVPGEIVRITETDDGNPVLYGLPEGF